ncbi:MAG TPA: hypothetical protein VFP27_06210 [Mycobacterium sp.]|nr:hypothetical protein [Mycobacterium sp.]
MSWLRALRHRLDALTDWRWWQCQFAGGHTPMRAAKNGELYTTCLRCCRRSAGIVVRPPVTSPVKGRAL